jgi:hypothetical protein
MRESDPQAMLAIALSVMFGTVMGIAAAVLIVWLF